MDALHAIKEELRIFSEGNLEALNLDASFGQIAEKLMTRVMISAPSGRYWLDEIEFYFYADRFCRDKYAHCHLRQSDFGNWYFHRYRIFDSFMRFSRNGVDITFGNLQKERYGGILLRAIRTTTDNRKITGINKSVKTLIEGLKAQEVDHLAFEDGIGLAFDPRQPLHLIPSPRPREGKVVASQRKGLNSKVNEVFWKKKWNFSFISPDTTRPTSPAQVSIR